MIEEEACTTAMCVRVCPPNGYAAPEVDPSTICDGGGVIEEGVSQEECVNGAWLQRRIFRECVRATASPRACVSEWQCRDGYAVTAYWSA